MGNATRKFPGISAFDTIVVESLLLTGQVSAAVYTVGTESTADAIAVAVQLNDFAGDAMAVGSNLPWYLSSDSAGQVLAAVPSGGIAIGTDGLLVEQVTNSSGIVTAEADGDIDVIVTDTTTRDMYLVLVLPTGLLAISDVLEFST